MYTLDTNMAVEGSSVTGGGIQESGAYVGKIVEAKVFKSDTSQAGGIEFTFERTDGAQAKFLRVYETKKDGQPAFGVNMIHALMCVMQLRQVTQLVEFCKPVGLVLQRENYTKQDNTEGYKFNIVAPFHPQNRKTAEEMIKNTEALTVDKIVQTLIDKQAKPQQQVTSAYQQYAESQSGSNTFEDDIPF